MSAMTAERVAGKSLVPKELFARLTALLVRDEGLTPERAERVMDQALAFLGAIASNPNQDVRLTPSKTVDPGWHAFVLHTREYKEWCAQNVGHFIHHNPLPGTGARDGIVVRQTIAAIEAAGYRVDRELWGHGAECNAPTCDGDDGRPY